MRELIELEPTTSFARIARALMSEPDVRSTLGRIAGLAVATIEGCTAASIAITRGRQSAEDAHAGALAQRMEELQVETGEGPAFADLEDSNVLVCADVAAETRWPTLARRVAEELGSVSFVSFRLFTEERKVLVTEDHIKALLKEKTIGRLTLYADGDAGGGDERRSVGALFAEHGAMALGAALRQEQLEEALRSRDVIGQAKGILMAREGITADEAFLRLRRASQRLNLKLRDVADQVTFTGSTP